MRSNAAAARYDAVIVGGGHNGLACACYLAAGGLKVGVYERRGVVGGAAVTEEFHPGFRNSTASYTVSLLHPQVIRDLKLAEHGLRIVERPIVARAAFPYGDRVIGDRLARSRLLRNFAGPGSARACIPRGYLRAATGR